MEGGPEGEMGGEMGGGPAGGFEFGGGEELGGEFGGGEELGGEFGESFRGDENIIDKLLVEGRKKNEDIFMMTNGIDDLLKEENGVEDVDNNDLSEE
jgi:hypothetical protein